MVGQCLLHMFLGNTETVSYLRVVSKPELQWRSINTPQTYL
jgi:hypothetical protein